MRHALLVGSMPFRDEEDCMRRALAELGPYLFSLPDGEVGERTPEFPDGTRACWIIRAVEILYKDRESWRVVKEPVRARNGVPASYDGLHQLEPLCQPEDVPHRISFGYDKELARYYPVEKWPRDRELVYMHYPLAAGNVPPSTDPELYQPLADIRLPEGTHFVAGFVHEGLAYEENAGILRSIEDARGGTVDVASSCGIGRRTPEVAEQLLRFTARLAAS